MFKYNSKAYIRWRDKIFRRDKFQCQLCDCRGTINAHHIKRKVDFPKLVYELTNGITLCEVCHQIITGYEGLFINLFIGIVKKTLQVEFIYQFFSYLTQCQPEIVIQFKRQDKWLKIPNALIKKIKRTNVKNKKAK